MLKKFLMASCAIMIACSPAFAADKKPALSMGPVDANKDSIVSTAEAMGAADKQFAQLDGNKDGKITDAEFKAAGKASLANLPPKFLEKNKSKIEAGQKKRLAILDTDKNGEITKAEMQADMQKRHKAMDLNNDGNVTKEELVKFHDTMKAKKDAAKK
jgi:Ca2+-binding EF-hand superfamily protein